METYTLLSQILCNLKNGRVVHKHVNSWPESLRAGISMKGINVLDLGGGSRHVRRRREQFGGLCQGRIQSCL